MEGRLRGVLPKNFISYLFVKMEKKKVRAILQDELVDGVSVKKGEIFETELADYLLNNYSNHRELVSNDEKVEKKEEKAEKKVSKKK